MFVQALWKLLEVFHRLWRRSDTSLTFVVLSIAVALAAMLIPAIFVPAGIALECRRVEPNEGTCEIKTYRLLGSSFAAIPIQQISHAEAVRVDSKDDEGNPQICYRVDLQFDDARSAWLTGCHLDAGQAQKLAASVNDFVGDKAKTALSHYDSEPWIFLTAIFLGAVVFLGIGILLLLKIMRQKKPVPSWRDRPSPSPFGILIAMGIGAACLAGIVVLAANSFSYGMFGPVLGSVSGLIATGLFVVCGIGAAGYLIHSVLAWMIFRKSVAVAPARVKRFGESITNEYGEKHTKYKLTVRFKAGLPDGTVQSMQVEIPVNHCLYDSYPDEFVVRYAQLDPHIFLLPGE